MGWWIRRRVWRLWTGTLAHCWGLKREKERQVDWEEGTGKAITDNDVHCRKRGRLDSKYKKRI